MASHRGQDQGRVSHLSGWPAGVSCGSRGREEKPGIGDRDWHFEKGVVLGQELQSGLAWEKRKEAPADPSPGARRL